MANCNDDITVLRLPLPESRLFQHVSSPLFGVAGPAFSQSVTCAVYIGYTAVKYCSTGYLLVLCAAEAAAAIELSNILYVRATPHLHANTLYIATCQVNDTTRAKRQWHYVNILCALSAHSAVGFTESTTARKPLHGPVKSHTFGVHLTLWRRWLGISRIREQSCSLVIYTCT